MRLIKPAFGTRECPECCDARFSKFLNSGHAWALVGSGASTDAGGPSWGQLVEDVLVSLPPDEGEQILDDDAFGAAVIRNEFPRAFGRMESIAGRDHLEEAVSSRLRHEGRPGELTSLLADFPFAGYVTTNYDSLLEHALTELGERGWVSVGNTESELPKITAEASKVVWHIHGSIDLPRERSRLVVTDRDYDDMYLQENPFLLQLRALLLQRRLVIVGFGLQDPEFMRVLKLVGRLTTPARPIFAFLSDTEDENLAISRRDLRERYNVDLVSYRVIDDSHRELIDLLRTYGGLTLRRRLTFGKPKREVPSYDAETTGLLLYNGIVLREERILQEDVFDVLLESRILALLKHRGPARTRDFEKELQSRAELLSVRRSATGTDDVQGAVSRLADAGLIETAPGNEGRLRLTIKGNETVATSAASAELMSDKFSSSVRARAARLVETDPAAANRVASRAEAFFRTALRERALGVAMAWAAWSSEHRQFQLVALLQELPEFMDELEGPGEAVALSRLIQEVLASPNSEEQQFLGFALQAQFGVHMLGYDAATLRVRAKELTNTYFLIDGNNLISVVARSSWGHDAATRLVKTMHDFSCGVGSTHLLAVEVAEHADWASRNFSPSGAINTRTLEAATGRAGRRPNAFVEGFLQEFGTGQTKFDFLTYLADVFGISSEQRRDLQSVEWSLEQNGIRIRELRNWEGFKDTDWAEVEEEQQKIAVRRRGNGSYTHERQVKAEAEALVIIRRIRDQTYRDQGRTYRNALFVSNTRIIDEIDPGTLPVTIRPELLFHWIATLVPVSPEEAEVFTSSLFGELFQRGLTLVDEAQLRALFTPLLSAAKADLREIEDSHRALLLERYGEEGVATLREADPLEVPVVVESLHHQRADSLEVELESERRRRVSAEQHAAMTEDERRELARFRARQAERQSRERRRRRKDASRFKRK